MAGYWLNVSFNKTIVALQLSRCPRLRDGLRNDLFPSADMILSMSREFGVPMTAEDFDGTGHLIGSIYGLPVAILIIITQSLR